MRGVCGPIRASVRPTTLMMAVRCIDKADYLLPLHRREAFQEIINGLAAFEIVDKVLNWNPGFCENGSAAHYFRIGGKDVAQIRFAHLQNLTPRKNRSKYRIRG